MKSHSAHQDNKSIKTFFIYTVFVFLFIFISLSLKAFLIVKQSHFDGKNQFIVAIAEKQIVKEVVVFHPSERTALLIKIEGKDLQLSSIGKTLGIIPDGKVNTSSDLPLTDIAATMRAIASRYYSLKTNLTIFDIGRLMFLSQKISTNNQTTKEITLSKDMESNDKLLVNFFTDEKIFSENISIQIINASGIPGIGKRLERALTHLGCNVISVSTSRDNKRLSKIQFFGKETYTITKLERLLSFPAEKIKNQSIADIILIIGEDNKSPENF